MNKLLLFLFCLNIYIHIFMRQCAPAKSVFRPLRNSTTIVQRPESGAQNKTKSIRLFAFSIDLDFGILYATYRCTKQFSGSNQTSKLNRKYDWAQILRKILLIDSKLNRDEISPHSKSVTHCAIINKTNN